MHVCKPRHLVALLLGCAGLGYRDLLLLDDTTDALINKMQNCTAHEVAAALSACAALRFRHPRLLGAAARRLRQLLRRPSRKAVAAAELQLALGAQQEQGQGQEQVGAAELTAVVGALGALGWWQPAVWDALARRAAALAAAHELSNAQMLVVMRGFAAVRHAHAALATAVAAAAATESGGGGGAWRPGELALLACCQALLGHAQPAAALLEAAAAGAGVSSAPDGTQPVLWVRLAWAAMLLQHPLYGVLLEHACAAVRAAAAAAGAADARAPRRGQAAAATASGAAPLAQLQQEAGPELLQLLQQEWPQASPPPAGSQVAAVAGEGASAAQGASSNRLILGLAAGQAAELAEAAQAAMDSPARQQQCKQLAAALQQVLREAAAGTGSPLLPALGHVQAGARVPGALVWADAIAPAIVTPAPLVTQRQQQVELGAGVSAAPAATSAAATAPAGHAAATAPPPAGLAVLLCAPEQYLRGGSCGPGDLDGHTTLHVRLLQRAGWRVLCVAQEEWRSLGGAPAAQAAHLAALLALETSGFNVNAT